MNPFSTLRDIQDAYRTYVHTFQKFNNPAIRDWVAERVEKGTLLWREPYVELGRRFAAGDPFEQLVAEGVLQPATPACFTVERGKRAAPPVELRRHQSEAIRAIMGGGNTIVATGTGSGKSFCFGVPIVSECLRLRQKGVAGIKAVIIYPMNALANSQYEDFSERLAGSGLKLALYTGDTKNSPEEALKQYRELFGRESPYDSELLSREEIRRQLPDILMTNYVQLELLLTRFEDLVLFPPAQRGALRFLVLDEIHTYTGKRGADVACLIRRLKQHTGSIGRLRCIGTSATVESGEGEDARAIIADFAARLFGEPFAAGSVITETYAPLPDDLTPAARAIAERLAGGPQTVGVVAEALGMPREAVEAALAGGGRLTPKLHAFFSQGRAMTACLDPHGPHLNDRGERTCPGCAAEGRWDVPTYPMYFCRACGQEFYSVGVTADGAVHPRELDAVDFEGTPFYLYPGAYSADRAPLPDNWLTPKGNIKKDYQSAAPEDARYCPDCHGLVGEGHLAGACAHAAARPVCLVPAPFLLCPACGIAYNRTPRESNKLFTFGTVGRSTATDVLIGQALASLPAKQRKIIAFSDNRQDTALQAAHINSLQKRMAFRRALRQTLREHDCTEEAGEWMELPDLGLRLFRTLQKAGALPEYRRDRRTYGRDSGAERSYQRYLEYVALDDLEATHRYTHQNLEDVGLLIVGYNGLEDFAGDEAAWAGMPALGDVDPDVRYDYLLGFLDIMRKRLALKHEAWVHPSQFQSEVLDRLNEAAFFHSDLPAGPIGFADDSELRGFHATAHRFTGSRTALVSWTRRALGLDHAAAVALIPRVVEALADERAGFLVRHEVKQRLGNKWLQDTLYMVDPAVLLLQTTEREQHAACAKCGTIQHFKALDVCTGISCAGIQPQVDLSGNYFRRQYSVPLEEAAVVVAEEHSGQVSGDERKAIEARFKDREDPLNALVCTPTMELGIDIGDLSAIHLRNVPPSPSHYAQRAGRAGRREQASLITVFCGVGASRGPHDQYFYRFPEKIISGRIAAPRFLLDNQLLVTTHVHSLVLETLGQSLKLPSRAGELLDLELAPAYPLKVDLEAAYRAAIVARAPEIVGAVEAAFVEEMQTFAWFDRRFVEQTVVRFVDDLDAALTRWRTEYSRLIAENDEITRRQTHERYDAGLSRRRDVIEIKLGHMRDGQKDWYLYRYLGSEGFLPNYAFPRRATVLSFYNREDDLARDPAIALSEYAPGNFVYYRGDRYEVTHGRPETKEMVPDVQQVLVCPECQCVYLGGEATRGACGCGHDLRGTHPRQALALPDMFGLLRARITADEEERLRLGYDIGYHYQPRGHAVTYALSAGGEQLARLTYEHGGRIVAINRGPRQAAGDTEPPGFTLCAKCYRWLMGRNDADSHLNEESGERCSRRATQKDLIRGLDLYVDVQTDILVLDAPLPADVPAARAEEFYATLLYTLRQGAAVGLNLDESELGGFLSPDPRAPGRRRVILFEAAEGGAGALASLREAPRLRQIVAKAREILHENDPTGGCERACYECLLSFYNQRDHEDLDRRLVLPWLQSLDGLTVEAVTATPAGPTLDELDATCGSELERVVLRQIQARGLPLPDAGQKTLYQGDEPLAVADFYYEPKLVVFVDGSPHYQDWVAAGDERKRSRLKALGYRVVVIAAGQVEGGLGELAARLSQR